MNAWIIFIHFEILIFLKIPGGFFITIRPNLCTLHRTLI